MFLRNKFGLFEPSEDDKVYQQDIAKLLNKLIFAALVFIAIYTLIDITFLDGLQEKRLGAPVFLCVLMLLYFLRERYVNTVHILFILSFWVVIIFASFLSGGIQSPIFSILIIPLLLSTLLLSTASTIGLIVLSIIVAVAFVLLEQTTHLPQLLEYGSLTIFLLRVVSFSIIITMTSMVINTLRKSYQEAHEKERCFRLVIEQFPGILAIYDTDLRLQVLNETGVQLGGYTKEDYIGRKDTELYPPEITDNYIGMLKHVLQTGKPETQEITVRMSSHTQSNILTYVPLLDKNGEVEQIFAVNYDITDRKALEEELQAINQKLELQVQARTAELERKNQDLIESESRFRQMADSISQVFFLMDVKKRNLLYINAAYKKLTGYPIDVLYEDGSIDIEQVCHPDDRERLRQNFQKEMTTGAVYGYQYRIITPIGETRWLEGVMNFSKRD